MSNDLRKFHPRNQLNATTFECMFCGFKDIQWVEVEHENWMPLELVNNKFHQCPRRNINRLTRYEVIQYLQNIGFETYIPRSKTWHHALIASNKIYTIYFLVRRGGVDFNIYNKTEETKIDELGKLFVTNVAQLFRNDYSKSTINIHEAVLRLASLFITDTPLDEYLIPKKEKPISAIRSTGSMRNSPKTGRSEMRDMYSAMAHEDGEDAYLGGGLWIGSDGSLLDKGR